jgi:hypothetical protein
MKTHKTKRNSFGLSVKMEVRPTKPIKDLQANRSNRLKRMNTKRKMITTPSE